MKVLDLMNNVLTQANNPNIFLETIALRNFYLESNKSIEERTVEKGDDKEPKAVHN